MPATYHLTVRSQPTRSPLRDRDLCARIWQKLRERFVRVWACSLMPDHAHLVVETNDPRAARRELAIEMRAAARRYAPGLSLWEAAGAPQLIPNRLHLKRTIRYVHLNPCRDRLVKDPIEWEWSTHRDVLGATRESWVDLKGLAELFECPTTRIRENFHRYVSGDPSVAIEGTPLLRLPSPEVPIAASPSLCAQAIAIAARAQNTRVLLRGELRDAAVQLAATTARNSIAAVMRQFNLSDRAVRYALAQEVDKTLRDAALRVLSDDRCRKILSGIELPRAGHSATLR